MIENYDRDNDSHRKALAAMIRTKRDFKEDIKIKPRAYKSASIYMNGKPFIGLPEVEKSFIDHFLKFVDNPDLLENGLDIFRGLGD